MAKTSLRGNKKSGRVVPVYKLEKKLPDTEGMINRKDTVIIRSDGKVLLQTSGKYQSEYSNDNWYSGYTIKKTVEPSELEIVKNQLLSRGWTDISNKL